MGILFSAALAFVFWWTRLVIAIRGWRRAAARYVQGGGASKDGERRWNKRELDGLKAFCLGEAFVRGSKGLGEILHM